MPCQGDRSVSDERQDFISLALAGEVMTDEIDDHVDQWHDDPDGLPLHEYLGMTEREYALWLSVPDMLPLILAARKQGRPLEEIVVNDNNDSLRIAARADNALKIKRLQLWLRGRERRGDIA